MQELIYDLKATEDPDSPYVTSCIVNPDHGICIAELEDAIRSLVPTIDSDDVQVHKNIIRIDRVECPCCNTQISALVRVRCYGLVTGESRGIEGLYKVSITPERKDCLALAEKLTGTTVASKRVHLLPRKAYVDKS